MTAAAAPDPTAERAEPAPEARPVRALPRAGLPRWLVLALMSAYALVAAGVLWSIAQTSVVLPGCGYLGEVPPEGILPGPQPCGPDASVPALVTVWIIAVLLASAFVVAFTVLRSRGTVLLTLAGAMLLVGVIGAIATAVTASAEPPIIYY